VGRRSAPPHTASRARAWCRAGEEGRERQERDDDSHRPSTDPPRTADVKSRLDASDRKPAPSGAVVAWPEANPDPRDPSEDEAGTENDRPQLGPGAPAVDPYAVDPTDTDPSDADAGLD